MARAENARADGSDLTYAWLAIALAAEGTQARVAAALALRHGDWDHALPGVLRLGPAVAPLVVDELRLPSQ